jgi:hypothetical protein
MAHVFPKNQPLVMTRKRIVLNPETAREIEALAPSFADSMRRGVKSRLSNALAVQFGVDAKTIRDIWNRKSWKGFNSNSAVQRVADSFLVPAEEEPSSDDWGSLLEM